MVSKLLVVWGKSAEMSLKKAYLYINEDSPKNAEKVKNDIFESTRSLAKQPEKHPLDKFKKPNNRNYRVFEIHSYRIAYKITENTIRTLRLRHVKQEPKMY
jgi:plasmid stabilization system protein ParE